MSRYKSNNLIKALASLVGVASANALLSLPAWGLSYSQQLYAQKTPASGHSSDSPNTPSQPATDGSSSTPIPAIDGSSSTPIPAIDGSSSTPIPATDGSSATPIPATDGSFSISRPSNSRGDGRVDVR